MAEIGLQIKNPLQRYPAKSQITLPSTPALMTAR
jgi:hypothetical protein